MATLFISDFSQIEDGNGSPYAGALRNFYQTGTTTRITTYQDAAASTPHTNPVEADANGVFPPIFISYGGGIKVIDTTAAGVTLRTVDPVYATGGGAISANGVTFTPTGSIAATDVQAAIAELDGEKAAVTSVRKLLTGNTTLYVGCDLGIATVPVASPGVVTRNAHGLIAGDRVSFSIKPNAKAATISVASPAVATLAGHGFSAGQPFRFRSTGRLPSGVSPATTYYVLASGLATDTFQFAATAGGSAINTTAPSFTVTIASPGVFTLVGHGLAVGTPIQFATTGALPTGLAAATTYFIKTAPTADTFTVAATPEGTAINTSGGQSGTHTLVQFGGHQLVEWGTLPTGIDAGINYYVLATGLTANAFRISTTNGGSAINFTGSTEGRVAALTGNASGDGSAATVAGAMLTIQQAVDAAAQLDLNGYTVTIQLAEGHYAEAVALKSLVGGNCVIAGNNTLPGNVLIQPATSAIVVQGRALSSKWTIGGVRVSQPQSGTLIYADGGSIIDIGIVEIGPAVGGVTYHLNASGSGSTISMISAYAITGGCIRSHFKAEANAAIVCTNRAIAIYDQPAFGTGSNGFANGDINGTNWLQNNTFSGFATGGRYYTRAGGVIFVVGAGATALPGSIAGTGDGTGVYI